MAAKDMTNSQLKLTNSQKILNYLQENIGEISNEEISRETGINKTNIPREIKKLEAQGHKISKRYEQIGRAKFVWQELVVLGCKMAVLCLIRLRQKVFQARHLGIGIVVQV